MIETNVYCKCCGRLVTPTQTEKMWNCAFCDKTVTMLGVIWTMGCKKKRIKAPSQLKP